MSGNGIRCLAHAALDAGWLSEDVPFGVITPAGRREVTIHRGLEPGTTWATVGDGRSQGSRRGRSLQRRPRSAARRHRQPPSGGPRPRPGHGRRGHPGPAGWRPPIQPGSTWSSSPSAPVRTRSPCGCGSAAWVRRKRAARVRARRPPPCTTGAGWGGRSRSISPAAPAAVELRADGSVTLGGPSVHIAACRVRV